MNLATIVDPHPADAVALVSRGRATTYGELCEEVAHLRGGLASLGVGPDDRVALLLANSPWFVVSYLAVVGIGAVAVPMNPGASSPELQGELATTGARVVVAGPAGREALAGVDRAAVAVEHVVAPMGTSVEGSRSLEDLLDAEPVPVVDRTDDDLAVLMFTAGTAGPPKAAALSHANLRANLDQVQGHPGLALHADDVALGVLPLFHIFGLNVVLGLALRAGASVVLVERFDPTATLATVKEHGVTVIAGAPPIFAAWGTMPGADTAALDRVRLAVSGGAPLAPSVAEAFEARFDVPVWEGYGLTETAPIVTSSLVGGQRKRGSIGAPLPGIEVRLVDSDGEDAFMGDAGEVWVRGPNVFSGYWQDPEASAAVLTPEGWLRTGDIGVVDDDGYLFLVDRAKDLIIVSGFNVYPAEVEEVLLQHPGVAEVGVVGVDHPYTGETVRAYVVPEGGRRLDEDEVIAFTAGRLARYKCPTQVAFVDSLPQGLVGKVLRRALGAETTS